jgi:hypothetical protein
MGKLADSDEDALLSGLGYSLKEGDVFGSEDLEAGIKLNGLNSKGLILVGRGIELLASLF